MPSPPTEIRKYATWVLAGREVPDLVAAVRERIDVLYYVGAGIGTPEYHESIAQKAIGKLNLSDIEIARAPVLAQELYQKYQEGARIEKKPPNPINAKKFKLRERFLKLMGYSDVELRIYNSNETVDFHEDHVYGYASGEIKDRIRSRTLTAKEYGGLEREIERKEEEISLHVGPIFEPWRLNLYAIAFMNNPEYRKRGIDDWELFTRYVLDLLGGRVLSKTRLESGGINSKDVSDRVVRILKYYQMAEHNRHYDLRIQRQKLRRKIRDS